MAIYLLDESAVPPARTNTGNLIYMRNGRAVGRSVVKPVYPRTESQLREVAGVTTAARQWSNDMSPEEKSTFAGAMCCDIPDGYWLWVWLSSLLGWVLEWVEPGDFGGCLSPPEVMVCESSESGTSVVLTVNPAAGETASAASVAISRPLRPGRLARRSDMRVVGPVEVGVETDLTAAYVARFGGLPHPDQILSVQASVGDAMSRTASCPIVVDCVPGGGGQTCEIQPIPDTMQEFVSWLGVWTILTDPEDPSREFNLHLEGVGLTLNSGGPIFGGAVDVQYQVDNSNAPGDPVPWTLYIFDVSTMETLCEVSGVVTIEMI